MTRAGSPGPVLDGRRAHQRGVGGRTAGDDLDPGCPPERVLEPVDLGRLDVAVGRDAPGQRLAQRRGLLVDLLEHEVLVPALLGGLGRPVDRGLLAVARRAVDAGDHHAGRADVGHVALLEEDDPVGVGQDRRDVAGDEALLAVQADDQGHVLAGADEAALLALVHHDQRVRTLKLAQGGSHGIGQVALVGLLDEVGDRLGVRLRREDVAARLEAVAQVPEILDDPVVDHRDVAHAVLVRVGVEVVGPPVGRPAGVCEPDGRMGRAIRDRGLEVGELARLLLDEQVALLIDEGDARRVVASVLETPETLDQDGPCLAGPGVADDSAHAPGGSPWAGSSRPRRGWLV